MFYMQANEQFADIHLQNVCYSFSTFVFDMHKQLSDKLKENNNSNL